MGDGRGRTGSRIVPTAGEEVGWVSVSVATRYLLAVYELTESPGDRVSTSAISDAVDRSQPTTTEAIQRLAEHDLVEYEAYRGARLTDAGRREAASLHEEYEVLSRFFDDVLDIEDAGDEAAALVGIISPTVLARLDETVIAPVEEGEGADGASPPRSDG